MGGRVRAWLHPPGVRPGELTIEALWRWWKRRRSGAPEVTDGR